MHIQQRNEVVPGASGICDMPSASLLIVNRAAASYKEAAANKENSLIESSSNTGAEFSLEKI